MAHGDEAVELVAVVGGEASEGIVSRLRLTAGDMGPEHVGRFIGCSDGGVTYQAKILVVRRVETGPVPGLSLTVREPNLPHRAARTAQWHVPFDTEFELIELTAL